MGPWKNNNNKNSEDPRKLNNGGKRRVREKNTKTTLLLTSQGNIFEGFCSKDLRNKGDICKFKKMKSVFNY